MGTLENALFSVCLTILGFTSMAGGGAISYFEASAGNTGVVGIQSSDPVSDGGWELRNFATGGTVYEGRNDQGDLDLVTTISGLTPGLDYTVSVFFWDAGGVNDWRILAGFTPTSTAIYEVTGGIPSAGVSLASSATYISDPLFTESDRTLYRVELGTVTATDGAISVYIGTQPVADWPFTPIDNRQFRTWYDGIGLSGNPTPDPDTDAGLITFSTNGGWSWFSDETSIVDRSAGKLLVAPVADSNKGVHVIEYDLATGSNSVTHFNINGGNDHNNGAFVIRPDGRYLIAYAPHNGGPTRVRVSTNPGDATAWGGEQVLNSETSNVTYTNLHYLKDENGGAGRVYLIHRGDPGWDPQLIYSDDYGATWTRAGYFLSNEGRPYVKYASNGTDTIHFICTDGHPRDVNNNIYYGYMRDGKLHNGEGTIIDNNLFDDVPATVADLTRIWQGDTNNVGWVTDLHLDSEGFPYIAFSAQKNRDENDLRYYYGRLDAGGWNIHEMAFAGTRLYSREKDYSGLVALDPDDPDIVYISADVDPSTGAALVSSSDNRIHYEIFKGTTTDRGMTWSWEAVTTNSTVDNIRPIVPKWDDRNTALLWMRGRYSSYTDYDMEVVGLIMRSLPKPVASISQDEGNLIIRTTTQAGFFYQLCGNADLGLPLRDWSPIGDPVAGNGQPHIFLVPKSDLDGDPKLFFSIRVSEATPSE